MLNYTVHDMDSNEKPRERLINVGPEALSDSELLAIILRVGGSGESVLELSRKLLIEFGGYKGLREASVEQIQQFKNIGTAKAVSVKAMCEIALRIGSSDDSHPKITSPKDVFKLLRKDMFGKKKEQMYVLSLNSRNKLIAKDLVSVGTVTETIVHPREVYRQALVRNAVSIILVHNHPSQDPSPSSEDVLLTEDISKSGILLGIPLIDHIVITNSEYCSLKALGMFKTKKLEGREVKK